jgi:hypothetical protein
VTDEPTMGTTGQDDGDAQATGTPSTADQNASETPEQELARLRNAHNQALAEKETLERLKRENDELRRSQQYGAQTTPPTVDPRLAMQAQQNQEMAMLVQQTRDAAAAGDPVARLSLAMGQELYAQQQQMTAQTMVQLQLAQIPDARFRGEVEAELRTGRYADVEAARMAVLGAKFQTQQASLEQRQRELDEQSKRVAQGHVGSGRPIPVPAKDMNGLMPWSEVEAEHSRLQQQGKFAAARDYINQFRTGSRGVDMTK